MPSFRDFLRLLCDGCGHRWIAPKMGACPKCRCGIVQLEGRGRENAPRV